MRIFFFSYLDFCSKGSFSNWMCVIIFYSVVCEVLKIHRWMISLAERTGRKEDIHLEASFANASGCES